jgi:hypothetical protein
MEDIFQLLAYFDWSILPRTIVQTFTHADWRGAAERGGVTGLLAEAGASLIGTNCCAFFTPIGGPWSGARIERLLAGRGIKMWGVGFANGELFFRVSREQAAWAQYVMERAGVPLLYGGAPSDQPGPRTAAGQPARGNSMGGEEPAAQAVGPAERGDVLDRLMDTIDSLLP